MSERKRFIIWGSAGHAKVIGSLIGLCGGHVVALFDNNEKTISALPDVPLYIGKHGFLEWLKKEANAAEIYGIAAIGGALGADRLSIHHYFKQNHIRIATLIHPNASVCESARYGEGTQILAQSVVSSDTQMGDACVINHGAVLDHECKLGDGVHLAPHATLCGCVVVDDNVMIGAGAVVLPRLTIGANAIVGAGAVVTEDIPANVIVAGNPAKTIRKL